MSGRTRRVVRAILIAAAMAQCGCGQQPSAVGRFAVMVSPPSNTMTGATFKVDTVTGDVWILDASSNGRWQLVETDSAHFVHP